MTFLPPRVAQRLRPRVAKVIKLRNRNAAALAQLDPEPLPAVSLIPGRSPRQRPKPGAAHNPDDAPAWDVAPGAMTTIVVLDEAHRPLTLAAVPNSIIALIETGRRPPIVTLPVVYFQGPPTLTAIRLRAVRQVRGGNEDASILFWYAYALDPERALLVNPAFLPGQLAEARRLQLTGD